MIKILKRMEKKIELCFFIGKRLTFKTSNWTLPDDVMNTFQNHAVNSDNEILDVSYTYFSWELPHSSWDGHIFLDFSLEYSMSRPTWSTVLRLEVRSYPKNVPTFFNYRRFKGVEAPEEGHEKMPAKHTGFVLKITQFFLTLMFLAY